MSKTQIIEAIRRINPTAGLDWLAAFDAAALRRYLDHLELALAPRGNLWSRPIETRAVVTREPTG